MGTQRNGKPVETDLKMVGQIPGGPAENGPDLTVEDQARKAGARPRRGPFLICTVYDLACQRFGQTAKSEPLTRKRSYTLHDWVD